MIIISCEFVAQQNSFALVPEYCLTNIYKGINSFISACYSRILIQLNQNAIHAEDASLFTKYQCGGSFVIMFCSST